MLSAKIEIKKYLLFESLPNDKFLDVTKLKAFADDKSDVAKMMISLFDRIENTAGYFSHNVFQSLLLQGR